MMKYNILAIAAATITGAMLFASCSAALEEPEQKESDAEGMHSCEMIFNGRMPSFDADSRADMNGNWVNGDVIYLHFELDGGKTTYGNAVYNTGTKSWKVNYNGRLTSGKKMKCAAYFFQGGDFSVNALKSLVTPKSGTAIYADADAFYQMSDNVLTLYANLKPLTSRVKFTNSGTGSFQVRGIETIASVNLETMDIIYNSGDFDEDPISAGFNEYIYGTFSDDSELRVKSGDYVYVYEMPENHDGFMAVGSSGYMTLPLPDAHNGWSMYTYFRGSETITTTGRYANSGDYFWIDADDGGLLYFYPDTDYFYGNESYTNAYFEMNLADPSGNKTTYSTKDLGADNYKVIVPLSKGMWRVQYRGYYWFSNNDTNAYYTYNKCYYGNF